jgi:hypothetical protein
MRPGSVTLPFLVPSIRALHASTFQLNLSYVAH